MKTEMPKISTKKPPRINIDSIIKKDLDGAVSKVNEEYKFIKRTVNGSNRITKSISFTEHELNVINAFLQENKLLIGDFVRLAFYRDGAFSDAFLAGTSIQKRMNIDFINIAPNTFTFEYKKNFEKFEDQLAQDVAYNSSKRRPKSMFLLDVMDRRVQEHLDKRGFPSFSSFVKVALSTYGVYSKALSDVVLSGLHTTKTQAKSKKMKNTDRKEGAKPLSGALHPQAHLLYTKYSEVLKEKYKGITLALVIKFILIKKKIITDTLLEKNSPKNPEKKLLVDSFLDDLYNNRIFLDFTKDEKKILKDKNGLRKNFTVSFSIDNFKELKDYLNREEATFPQLVIKWLQLEGNDL